MTVTISQFLQTLKSHADENGLQTSTKTRPALPAGTQIYIQGYENLGEFMVFVLADRFAMWTFTMMLQPPQSMVLTFVTDVDFTTGGVRYQGWGYSLSDPSSGPLAIFFSREPYDDQGHFIIMFAPMPAPYVPGDNPPWTPDQAVLAYRVAP